MPVVDTTTPFSNNEQITSTKLNNIMDNSFFVSGAVLPSSGLEVTAGGQMRVPNGGITSNELASNSVVTAKIADSNVTTAKILDSNVTVSKLAASLDLSGKTVTLGSTTTFANNSVPTSALVEKITIGTPVTASGTSVDFTSIPSWVKKITILFEGISTNGGSYYLVQLGSGSIQTTGYLSVGDNGGAITSNSSGMVICTGDSAWTCYGHMVITRSSGNNYITSHVIGKVTPTLYVARGGGYVPLSGALDRIRLTTVNGTDAFDAGSINIIYE
jgi:hypothetical protein